MVTQMKHLGLIFDKLLNFTEHFRIKTNKAKSDIARAANMMSVKTGCKPKAMLLYYKSTIRPTLTYGAICFSKRLQYKANIKKCTQIQSFAYSTMGLIRKSTPCAAIDVILNNMPLDLYIQGHASMSYFRLRGHETVDPRMLETCHPQLEGHIPYIKRWMERIGAQDLLRVQIDNIAKIYNDDKQFTLDKWSMDPLNPIRGYPPIQTETSHNMYTDGSLHEDYSSGGGFALYKNQWKIFNGHRGNEWYMEETEVKESFNAFYLYRSPIYQCEIWTILRACQYILENHKKHNIKSVTFFVDSHAAIYSLFSPYIKSQLVNQTIKALNELNKVTKKNQL